MKILFKSLFLTMVTLLLTFLTSKLSETEIFKTIFPETTALEEFEITDVAFKNRKNAEPNEDIVLINVSSLSRRELAKQIKTILEYDPKVIGLDMLLSCPEGSRDTISCPDMKDVEGNKMLSDVLAEAGNVVLATRLISNEGEQEIQFDSVLRSDSEFRASAVAEGYSNLETKAAYQDGSKTCRQFYPQMSIKRKMNYSFGVQLAMLYDSATTKEFLKRNHFSEIINYRGNVYPLKGTTDYAQVFYTLDVDDVMNNELLEPMLKDKIIIFGYLGETLQDPEWRDKYYTPLNKKITGKTTPDMYGLVIHANIISMILEGDYVDKLSFINEFVFAFFVCLLHIYILLLIKEKLPSWFDALALLLIFVQLVIYSYMRIFSMQYFSYNLTLIVTLGSLAIASLSINIFHEGFERLLNKRVNILRPKSQPVEKVVQ